MILRTVLSRGFTTFASKTNTEVLKAACGGIGGVGARASCVGAVNPRRVPAVPPVHLTNSQLTWIKSFQASASKRLSSSAADPVVQSAEPYLTRLSQAPPITLLLGLTGAIPFLSLTPPLVDTTFGALEALGLPAFFTTPLEAAEWQVGYGAVILSFLGGVHWGACLHGGPGASAARYIWSVTPSLVAWAAVPFKAPIASGVMAASFVAVYFVDVLIYAPARLLPAWYAALRLPLSTFAASSLLLTSYTLTHGSGDPDRPIKSTS